MGSNDPTRDDRGSGTLLPQRFTFGTITGVLKAKVAELSYAERLLIWRRRSGHNQTMAAKLVGVCRNTYTRMELGDETRIQPIVPYLGELYDNEACVILRRRSGWPQWRVAEEMGISRFWVNQMELGYADANKLVGFWNEG